MTLQYMNECGTSVYAVFYFNSVQIHMMNVYILQLILPQTDFDSPYHLKVINGHNI